MKTTKTTGELLEDWGKWARAEVASTMGYSRMSLALGSTVKLPSINEDEALWVDYAVCRLKRVYPDQAELLQDYFVKGWTVAMMARNKGVSRQTMGSRLNAAEAFIDGLLQGLSEPAASYG